jgi:hypothetical protein
VSDHFLKGQSELTAEGEKGIPRDSNVKKERVSNDKSVEKSMYLSVAFA